MNEVVRYNDNFFNICKQVSIKLFQRHKGAKDKLSLYLFVMIMKAFS